MKNTILVVDDDKTNLALAQKILASRYRIAASNSGAGALKYLENHRPELILLDINMPEADGIGTLKELNRRKYRPKILILTVHNEIEYLMKVLDLGVDGYILKDSSSKELIRAIRFVYEG